LFKTSISKKETLVPIPVAKALDRASLAANLDAIFDAWPTL